MIISAQDLARTTTCEAADCPDDADAWGLCTRHARQQARGQHVRMHVIPELPPDRQPRKKYPRPPRAELTTEEVAHRRALDSAKRKRRLERQRLREAQPNAPVEGL